jgi:hypothetical protein
VHQMISSFKIPKLHAYVGSNFEVTCNVNYFSAQS